MNRLPGHHHCGKNHCLGLPLPDGMAPVTPDGECRQCVRDRQRRWRKTDKGQKVADRYEYSSKGILSRMRWQRERAEQARDEYYRGADLMVPSLLTVLRA